MIADAKTEAEVLSSLNKHFKAYENRDLNAVLSLYSEDDGVIVYGSGADEKRVGLKEIRKQVERDFEQSESVSVKVEWSSVSSAGSIAWVAADISMIVKHEERKMRLPARFTGVLEKRKERWYWMQSHFSLPASGQAEGESFPQTTKV